MMANMYTALLEKLDDKGGFYNNKKLPLQKIDCILKATKFQMVKDKNNNDVQSKTTYLFNIGTDIKVGDFLDGCEVISTSEYKGISIGTLVVLT